MSIGTVAQLFQYPVKSMQGSSVSTFEIAPDGVVDDRRWALIDDRGKLCSAKRYSKLFEASARADGAVELPDGTVTRDDAAISAWLGVPVRLVERTIDTAVSFEMTFDPPNDDAEFIEWPAPPGTFLDVAAVQLVTTATLAYCAQQRPDLDWNIRRYRPNMVLDVDVEPFGEDAWVGRDVRIGDAVIHIDSPTIRCAMPLRAQPGGIERQPELFHALNELHDNFLGLYCSVVTPGTVSVGATVELAES